MIWLFGAFQDRYAVLKRSEQRLECQAAGATIAHVQHHNAKNAHL